MRKVSCFCTLLLTAFLHGYPQQQELETLLREENVSGIQLVHAKGGKIQSFCAGVISDGSQQNITPSTIFHAASLSKSVFAYAFFRLYDKGVISLDTPLLKYIGRYDRFKPYDPRFESITARMVLRHTSGLPNWGDSSVSLLFTPDSSYAYSGEGYWFLQRVLEKITGKSLNAIAEEEVFIPLGLKNSSFVWEDRFAARVGFDHNTPRDHWDSDTNAAFSLLTNAEDYTVFLQALLEGKGLKPATHRLIVEKATPADRLGIPKNAADPYIDWGLGVGFQQNEKGTAIWHLGDGYRGDYKCAYIAYPDTKESLVYFTHSRNGHNILADIWTLFAGPQTCWGAVWMGNGYEDAPSIKTFRAALTKRGFDQAAEIAEEEKKKDAHFNLKKSDLKTFGLSYWHKGERPSAVAIFRLNVLLYPQSWDVHETLAEVYEVLGDRENAIKSFNRSLELNPENSQALEHLKKLNKAGQ